MLLCDIGGFIGPGACAPFTNPTEEVADDAKAPAPLEDDAAPAADDAAPAAPAADDAAPAAPAVEDAATGSAAIAGINAM